MENSAHIDRISNLPDELLSHILSFLPTKLAFTTTILSKRWTPLFKLLTTLSFDDESVRDNDSLRSFRCFVDMVTLSTQLIKTFHLKSRNWCNDWYQRNFDTCMETVKQHPVENLHITSLHIFFPPSIFIFPTLVVLKLECLVVDGNISVDLPLLKRLHLIDVYFKNQQNFNNVLYGCPVLENLVTLDIHYKEQVEDVTVSKRDFNSLSKLITADIHAFDVPLRVISNVKVLTLEMMKKHLVGKINYMGFSVFRNLINLHLRNDYFQHCHWDDVVEVLQYCPKLQILYLKKWESYNHLSINWKDPNHVPKCISFELKSCTIECQGGEGDFQFSKYILRNALNLEVMKIVNRSSFNPNSQLLEELFSCPMISSQCKLSIE